MKIETSFAQLKDSKELEKIDKIANEEFKWWHLQSKKKFENAIKKSRYLIVIARINQKMVGYLEASFKNEKTIWIENIYTSKYYRKKQVVKQLIKDSVKHWKNKVDNIVLLTADRNKKTFEKLGFKKTMNYMEFVGKK